MPDDLEIVFTVDFLPVDKAQKTSASFNANPICSRTIAHSDEFDLSQPETPNIRFGRIDFWRTSTPKVKMRSSYISGDKSKLSQRGPVV